MDVELREKDGCYKVRRAGLHKVLGSTVIVLDKQDLSMPAGMRVVLRAVNGEVLFLDDELGCYRGTDTMRKYRYKLSELGYVPISGELM